jgi:uncharacterized protein YecE (DUF72 family)
LSRGGKAEPVQDQVNSVRIGVGGWTYPPWRGLFYPRDLPQARELEFASRALTAIEINSTFYGSQKPANFRRWAEETPPDFVFSLKGPRFATHRKVLAEAAPSVDRFIGSGPTELKEKLGPILWQFPPYKKFEAEDFEAFLTLLPAEANGMKIRHALDVRHPSFAVPGFIALARRYGVAIAYTDAEKYPHVADVTADFVYARLQRAQEDMPTGYSPAALKKWSERARGWAAGGEPDDLPRLAKESARNQPREIFLFMINGAKERAPAAAMALIKELKKRGQ